MRLRSIPAVALAAALGACAGAAPDGAIGPAGDPVPGGVGDRIYVTSQDAATVTIIDASSHEVVGLVDLTELGFSANAKPHHVVADPDGSHWYVSLIGENRVLKLDARDRVVGQAEFEVPGMLAYDLETDRLFVGRSMSAVNPPQRIGVIDRDDMRVVEEIAVLYPRPHALEAHPRAVHVYSSSLAANQMAVVDPDEEDVRVQALMEGHTPVAGTDHGEGDEMVHTLVDFAIAPDGSTMVGTGEMSGQLLAFDLTDPGAPRLTRQIPVGRRPWHPVFSPDGGEVWVPNKGDDNVVVVETAGWTVMDTISGDGFSEPHGAAFSPDGRFVFISNNDLADRVPGAGGTVVVIDAETRDVVKVIPVGPNATGVGTRARP